jgi:hypothetical protein
MNSENYETLMRLRHVQHLPRFFLSRMCKWDIKVLEHERNQEDLESHCWMLLTEFFILAMVAKFVAPGSRSSGTKMMSSIWN